MKMNKKTLLMCAGAVFLLLVAAYITFVLMAKGKVTAAYERISKAGYPMTVEEILPPVIDAADNAAPLYEAAHVLLESSGFEYLENTLPDNLNDVYNEQQLSDLKNFLAKAAVQNALNSILDANQKAACVFLDDYSGGPYMLLPHISWYVFPFLNAAFHYEFDARHLDRAQEMLRLQITFSKRLNNEPFLISHLVVCSQLKQISSQLRLLAARDLARSNSLLTLVNSIDLNSSLKQSIHSERLLLSEWVFNLPDDQELGPLFAYNSTWTNICLDCYQFTPFWELDHAASLNCYLKLHQYMDAPYTTANIDFELADYHMLTNMLLPALGQTRANSLETTAELRITQAGIQVLHVQQKQGQFPESLSAANITAVDPFNEKPLSYTRTKDGFLITSVGKNASGGPDAPHWEYTDK